jgi:soluble lytic murein transglycosylase
LSGPPEGAFFAETIPFTATRVYVKNVLSNANYYSSVMNGSTQSLKQRLGVITPKAATQSELP